MMKMPTSVSILVEVSNVSETEAKPCTGAVQLRTLRYGHWATLDGDIFCRWRYALKHLYDT